MVRFGSRLFAVVALLASASQTQASVLFSASANAQSLSAMAPFTISGEVLTILLTNTDTARSGTQWVPSEVLTGLFFNLGTSAHPLTGSPATIGNGKTYNAGSCDAATCSSMTNDVGGEWAYGYNSGWSGGGTQGTSGGINFGILPSSPGGYPLNGGLSSELLIKGALAFVLDVPDSLTDAMISNVTFAYGASTSGRGIPGGYR